MASSLNSIKDSVLGLLQQQFTLCYRANKYSNDWTCEYGFRSVNDIDERAKNLKKANEDAVTTFYPFNINTPVVLQEKYIKYKLTPTIKVVSAENARK